jgi:hypothetical protein
MGGAAIDKLREGEHAALITPPLLDKITPVNKADLFEGAVFEQCPKQIPNQDGTVNQRSCLFVFIGLAQNLEATLPKLRILLYSKIPLEKGLRSIKPV